MKIKLLFPSLRLVLFTIMIIVVNQAKNVEASAFYNRVYTDVNRAFAGDVAAGRDASTVHANPAGMVLLERPEIKGGGGFAFSRAEFNDNGSTLPDGRFSSSGDGGDPFGTDFMPNLYIVYPFEHMAVGVGITTPYTIDTNYNSEWIGRFNTIRTKIDTINIAPTIAFDVTDWLTFGVGVDIQYTDVELSKAKFPSDALIQVVTGRPLTIQFLVDNDFPIPEFRSQLKASDWSFGINTGIIVQPVENLKLGLNFRSATTHALDGQFRTVNVPTRLADTNADAARIAAIENLAVNTDLRLPHILTFGGSWDVTPNWNIGTQAQWFNWNRFNQMTVISKETGSSVLLPFDPPPGVTPETRFITPGDTVDVFLPQHFRNTFSFSVGTEYWPSDCLALELGFLYDQTPTQDAYRSPAIPDGDTYWLTTGLTYEFIPGISGKVGYAHIFMDDAPVNLTSNAAFLSIGTNNSTIRGFFDSAIDILSFSLRLEF